MSLKDIVADSRPIGASFEFFPPKTTEMEEQLWCAVKRLEPLRPAFVSVTYGAGGSTRDRTHATVKRIVEETTLRPAAHLTCVAATRHEVDEVVRGYWQAGVRHIVALRGDMPEAGAPYAAHPQGYASTPELIEGVRAVARQHFLARQTFPLAPILFGQSRVELRVFKAEQRRRLAGAQFRAGKRARGFEASRGQ